MKVRLLVAMVFAVVIGISSIGYADEIGQEYEAGTETVITEGYPGTDQVETMNEIYDGLDGFIDETVDELVTETFETEEEIKIAEGLHGDNECADYLYYTLIELTAQRESMIAMHQEMWNRHLALDAEIAAAMAASQNERDHAVQMRNNAATEEEKEMWQAEIDAIDAVFEGCEEEDADLCAALTESVSQANAQLLTIQTTWFAYDNACNDDPAITHLWIWNNDFPDYSFNAHNPTI